MKLKELLEKDIEMLDDGTFKIKEEEHKGKWKLKLGETYYFIDDYGNAFNATNNNSRADEHRFKYRPVFKTEEECESWHLKNGLYKHIPYCYLCGQRIDWSDFDE